MLGPEIVTGYKKLAKLVVGGRRTNMSRLFMTRRDVLLAAGEFFSSVVIDFVLLASFLIDPAIDPPVIFDLRVGGVATGLIFGGDDLLSVGDRAHRSWSHRF